MGKDGDIIASWVIHIVIGGDAYNAVRSGSFDSCLYTFLLLRHRLGGGFDWGGGCVGAIASLMLRHKNSSRVHATV